jgi:hypothetical protein
LMSKFVVDDILVPLTSIVTTQVVRFTVQRRL